MAASQEVGVLYNLLIGGGNVRIARYPIEAAGTTLTASGKTTGAYKYVAASANSKQIIAKATFTGRFKIVGIALDTPSATSIFQARVGRSTAAGAAATWLAEVHMEVATDAGGYVTMVFPAIVTSVLADGTNDVVVGDAASSNAGADDTLLASVLIATGILAP